jgi:glycosyltransferase involved in cell wall biosynthesis
MIPTEIEVIRIKAGDLWQTVQAWRSQRVQGTFPLAPGDKTNEVANGQYSSFRARLRELARIAEAWWYHPDMASPWIDSAVEATVDVSLRKRVSVIWATAGPVSSFYVAQLASRKAEIPYVLDFRDAWTITHNDFEARRPAWAIRRDRKKMYELLHEAQAVIFRYDAEAECFWRAYQGALHASRVYIIPNGYEPPIETFVASAVGDRCTVLYAGTLPDYRYDTLLESLRVMKDTNPDQAKQLRVRFVGEGMQVIATKAAALDLSGIIETDGPKSQAEIMKLQREAHALLVLGRSSSMKGYELFAGAKLFGYLKSGRPIVGVLPSDETKNVLTRVGIRTVADVDSVSEIAATLRLVLNNWSEGTLSTLTPDPKACEVYSLERQTASLVRALEGVPAEHPFIPGAQDIPPSLRATIESGQWPVNIG